MPAVTAARHDDGQGRTSHGVVGRRPAVPDGVTAQPTFFWPRRRRLTSFDFT